MLSCLPVFPECDNDWTLNQARETDQEYVTIHFFVHDVVITLPYVPRMVTEQLAYPS